MQYSFYGGQQGKNFEIAEIFANKVEMMQDLMRRYQSNISIGDLVLISYGMPNEDTPSYRANADLDVSVYGHTYNATLWQKIYTEESSKDTSDLTGIEIEYISKDFGLGYKLITVLTGNTPIFQVRYDALLANQKPSVTVDNTNIDFPILTFHLPVSQILALLNTLVLDADQKPSVTLDSTDIDNPKIQFSLPQAQILGLGTVSILDADEDPMVDIDDTNINKPKLNISLPQSQVLQLNPTIVLAPSKDPNADYDDTNINAPEITFSLPRAVRFMYGERLGLRQAGQYILVLADAPEIAGLNTGDYYVNEGTGFIYLVTAETTTDRTFEYQACLAAPVPTVTSAAVNPYEQDGANFVVKDPTINKSWTNPIEQIGLVLGFELPRLPDLKGEVDFCGPDEDGSITGKPTSATQFTYSFTIPSGARFFCGPDVDRDHLNTVVTGARPGDFYINGKFEDQDDGNIYKLGTNNVWSYQGNIKGNVGNPLNIIATFTITPIQVATDDKDDVAAYIEAQLGSKPDGHEIVAVTYRTPAADGGTIDTAYWYFVANNTWDRAQLTGATASLIENNYKAAGDTNKAYSVTYINSLLAALDTLTAADKKIKTYNAQAIEDLVTWGSFADL